MFIINFYLNMFRASLCPSSGERRTHYCIWCIVLVLQDVVGSGYGALSYIWCIVLVLQGVVGSGCGGAVLKEVSTMKVSVSPEDAHNDARNMLR
jgi:hypothetical protein